MPDIKTLMLIDVIVSIISAGTVVAIWSQNRGRYAGMFFWLGGLALWAAGLLLMILRGLVPDLISMTLANVMIMAGVLIILIGLERFTGKKGWQIHNYVLLAIFIAVSAYFAVIQPNLMARDIAVAAMTMVFTFQCCWLLLIRVPPGMRRITRLTGIVFAVFAALSFARIILTMISPEQSNDFFNSGAVNALVITGYTVLNICLIISLVLMVNRRLGTDSSEDDKALRESEEKFSKTFKLNPTPMAISTLSDGRYIDVNDSFLRLTGYSREEVIGHGSIEMGIWAKPGSRDRMLEMMRDQGEIHNSEYEFCMKSGEVRLGLLSVETISIGGQQCFLSILNDITERKLAEEAIKESEEKYRRLVETAGAGIATIDIEGNITFVNDKLCQITGYLREDIIGNPFADFLHKDDLPHIMEAFLNAISGTGISELLEFRLIRKDGQCIWVHSNPEPIVIDGRNIGFSAIIYDISYRKQAEEALAQSEERYRNILEQMHDSYFEVDLVGNFTFVNDATCRNLGYTMEELIGQNFTIIAPGKDEVKAIFEAYNKVYKTGEPYMGFTFKVIRKDGFVGYAEVSISVIKNEQDRPIGFRSVGRDHTERKQMEQKLEEMATHDALTGLPNRTLFYDRFGIAMAYAQRNKKKIAIMTLDLDSFKDVNDALGHDMGDKALIAVAGRLTGALRKSDTVARMGGDEFVLLLGEVDDKDAAVIVAEKILEDFRQPFISDGHSLKVTISIGIAIYPENGANMEELLRCSDKLLYTAKQNGGDRFAI